MSQNENSTTSSGQRLCHMVKRDDFDGYGFNLHSEKGKPGQYIGKVDENSPAEMAGLRQGDRIIEVNGVNIGSETHKQVVQRIKTICNEVRLLVIDPDVEQKQQQLTKTDTKIESTAVKHEIDNEKINPIGKDTPDDKSSPVSNKSRDQNDRPDHEQKLGPILKSSNDPNANSTTHQHNNNNYSSNNHNDNQHQQNNIIQSTTTTIVTTNSVTTPTIKDENSNGAPHHQNFSTVQNNQQSTTHLSSTSTSTSSTTKTSGHDQQKPLPPSQQQQQQQQSAPALNLPMTAAEMRAKLLARKKYDPKSDTVDLRKKFDIIQKL